MVEARKNMLLAVEGCWSRVCGSKSITNAGAVWSSAGEVLGAWYAFRLIEGECWVRVQRLRCWWGMRVGNKCCESLQPLTSHVRWCRVTQTNIPRTSNAGHHRRRYFGEPTSDIYGCCWNGFRACGPQSAANNKALASIRRWRLHRYRSHARPAHWQCAKAAGDLLES